LLADEIVVEPLSLDQRRVAAALYEASFARSLACSLICLGGLVPLETSEAAC